MVRESAKGGGEILALRELIEMLDIRGITITADALHCQRETCDLIVQEGGDYCMQIKGSQGDLQADLRDFVADQNVECIDEYTSVNGEHGRVEERSYRVYDVPDYLAETHPMATSCCLRSCRLQAHSEPNGLQLRAAVPPVKMRHSSSRRHPDPRPLGN